MRFGHLVRFVGGALLRQKGRTLLTLVGFAVGATSLAFTLSLGLGLRAMVDREFETRANFWDVTVLPADRGAVVPEADVPSDCVAVPPGVTGERRDRLRSGLVRAYQRSNPRTPPNPLTVAELDALAALPDVASVWAALGTAGTLRLDAGGAPRASTFVTTRRYDRGRLRPRVVLGTLPDGDDGDGVLLGEAVLLKLGLTTDAQFDAVIGRTLQVTVEDRPLSDESVPGVLRLVGGNLSASESELTAKVARQLPKAIDGMDLHPLERAALQRLLADQAKAKGAPADPVKATATFRVAAVIRDLTAAEQDDAERRLKFDATAVGVLLPFDQGSALIDRLPTAKAHGYDSAELSVRPSGDLRAVVTAVEAAGFKQFSLLEWYDSVRTEVTMIAGGLNLFSVVALFVAGIGITNTLATSVVERTREIGILKAVGATGGQVLRIFLFEGTVLGLVGGLLGVLAAYAISWPADRFVSQLVTTQSQGMLKASTVFVFPLWLPVGTVAFTVAATTAAAYLPARRAAKMPPVEALRAI